MRDLRICTGALQRLLIQLVNPKNQVTGNNKAFPRIGNLLKIKTAVGYPLAWATHCIAATN